MDSESKLRSLSELRMSCIDENNADMRALQMHNSSKTNKYLPAMSKVLKADKRAVVAESSHHHEDLYEFDYGMRAWKSYSASLSFISHSLHVTDPSAALKDLMIHTDKRRLHISKRRRFDDEQDVSYINFRNMKFNSKLSRAFEVYTSNIRASL